MSHGTTAELLREYRQWYTLLVPSNESKEIAKNLKLLLSPYS
jgi:hypothetical protein